MCALLPGGLPAVRAAEGETPAESADTLTDAVPPEAAEQPDAGPAPLADQPRAASRTVDLTVEAAAHCTVYYSEGEDLQQVEAGTRINETTTGPYGIVFFAAPEEGYALTVLAAVSTQQKHYTISNWSDDGSGMTAAEQAACDEYVDALKDHAGFTDEQLRAIVSQARDLGCDGSLMFTRGADNSGGISSTLQFRAERLPTLEKEILSVTGADGVEKPYQPGVSVGAGDVVTYGLTVTAYRMEYPVDSVYYTGVTVTDPKTGNGAEDPIPFTLPGKQALKDMTEDREITREVTYTVTQADADAGTLSNEAQLHFQYASAYSAGSLSTTSSAQATVLVRSPVRYAYVSADPDLELPRELADLTPEDPAAYDYQAEVTALGHAVTTWEDRERQGTWTLTAGGDWDLAGTAVSPGTTFSMPMEAVTLTASWSFAPWAAIRVERSAQVTAFRQDEEDQNRVRYGAEHTIAIQNTGGELLTRFVLQDAALPGEEDYTCKIHGEVVTPTMSYDPESGTFAVELPGGLPAGETLTITFAKGGSALAENGIFTLQCQVEVRAWGGRGVQAQDDARLQAPFSLSDAIVLTPADIVIYVGGAPSDSEVVDDDRQVVAGSNLPEPGFFVALPTGLAAKLREKVGSTGLQEGKIDLSGLLEFRRGDEKGWQLEKFDADGYSLARGSFLYRLVPPEEGQDPVQMQFYDGQDYIVASDFDISQALHKEYAMRIYPGGETGSEVKAVVQVEGLTENTYTLGFAPGRLIIRGTTGDRDTVAILPPEEAPGEAVAAITAQAPAEVHYYINSSQLQVDDPGAVELLVDSIADSDHHETMKRLAEPVLSALGTDARTRYQFRYLDLVDTSMGNAWVTADRPVEVYWPYPEGTGPGDDFTIIHYAGLDREFDLEDLGSLALGTDYDLEVFTTVQPLPADGAHVTYHALTAAEQGLRFAAGSFSPYVLVWEEPEGGALLPAGGDGRTDLPRRAGGGLVCRRGGHRRGPGPDKGPGRRHLRAGAAHHPGGDGGHPQPGPGPDARDGRAAGLGGGLDRRAGGRLVRRGHAGGRPLPPLHLDGDPGRPGGAPDRPHGGAGLGRPGAVRAGRPEMTMCPGAQAPGHIFLGPASFLTPAPGERRKRITACSRPCRG